MIDGRLSGPMVLLWPLVACGVRAQDRSEPVPVTNVAPTPDPPQDAVGRQDALCEGELLRERRVASQQIVPFLLRRCAGVGRAGS